MFRHPFDLETIERLGEVRAALGGLASRTRPRASRPLARARPRAAPRPPTRRSLARSGRRTRGTSIVRAAPSTPRRRRRPSRLRAAAIVRDDLGVGRGPREQQRPMSGQCQVDGRVQPVAGVVADGRQARRLAQHQRRLLDECGIGAHRPRTSIAAAPSRRSAAGPSHASRPSMTVSQRVRRSDPGVGRRRAPSPSSARRASPARRPWLGTSAVAMPEPSAPASSGRTTIRLGRQRRARVVR